MTIPAVARKGVPMPWLRIGLLWLVLCLILLAVGAANVAGRVFPDPDDTLRLVEVRDLMAGQGWFDLHQYRIDPPAAVLMHWSRIVDLPIALIVALLSPLLGREGAENAALILVPMITTGALMLVVARIALQSLGREVLPYCCLAIGLSPLLAAQLQPLRIDHHGWQIFAAVLAVLGLMPGRERHGPVLAGLALAAGLTISLELLPIAAAFGAVFALRWLRDAQARWGFVRFMAALTGGLALLYLATHGLVENAIHCDAISPLHLATFAVLTAGGLVVARFWPRTGVTTFLLLGLVGAAGAGTYLAMAPQCLAGPFGSLDPLVREFWYMNVLEGRPVWELPWYRAIEAPLPGLVALTALALLIRGTSGETRIWWCEYLLITAACYLTGLAVWRSLAFVGALAAVPVGWLASRLMARMREAPETGAKLLAAVAVSLVLVPGIPVKAAHMLLPERRPEIRVAGNATIAISDDATCPIHDYRAQFARLTPGTVLAPLDISPSIVESTPHSVVATGHHRGAEAMRDVVAAMTGSQEQAHRIAAVHGVRYVMLCTAMSETYILARKWPDGFAAQLIRGQTPGWLRPVRIGAPPSIMLWEVVR